MFFFFHYSCEITQRTEELREKAEATKKLDDEVMKLKSEAAELRAKAAELERKAEQRKKEMAPFTKDLSEKMKACEDLLTWVRQLTKVAEIGKSIDIRQAQRQKRPRKEKEDAAEDGVEDETEADTATTKAAEMPQKGGSRSEMKANKPKEAVEPRSGAQVGSQPKASTSQTQGSVVVLSESDDAGSCVGPSQTQVGHQVRKAGNGPTPNQRK